MATVLNIFVFLTLGLEQIAFIIIMQSSNNIINYVSVLVNSKKPAFSLVLILKLNFSSNAQLLYQTLMV